jgi:hypothetical protein
MVRTITLYYRNYLSKGMNHGEDSFLALCRKIVMPISDTKPLVFIRIDKINRSLNYHEKMTYKSYIYNTRGFINIKQGHRCSCFGKYALSNNFLQSLS